jgi:hypothetical protein
MLNGHFSKKVAKDHNLKKKWPKIIITLTKTWNGAAFGWDKPHEKHWMHLQGQM